MTHSTQRMSLKTTNILELMDSQRLAGPTELKISVLLLKGATYFSKMKWLGSQMFYMPRDEVAALLANIDEMLAEHPEAKDGTMAQIAGIVKELGDSPIQHALPHLCLYEARRDDMSFDEIENLGFELVEHKDRYDMRIVRKPFAGTPLHERVLQWEDAA